MSAGLATPWRGRFASPESVRMTFFQLLATVFASAWLAMIFLRFRQSKPFLLSGLFIVPAVSAVALAIGRVRLADFGLDAPTSWPVTIAAALGWTLLMFAYTPIADRLASHWFTKPQTLGAFRAIQQSKAN